MKIQFNSDDDIPLNKQCLFLFCHYWYFKDIGFKYQPYVCNWCHDLSMVAQNLNNFVILNIKGVDYRYYLSNMSKKDPINLLNNSVLDNKGVL